MRKLDDRVVFITGASVGIGAALARRCAAEGAAVALTARRADKLDAIAAEIRARGGKALALAADVTKDGELDAAAARTRAELGRIDVVIANAGFGVPGAFDELTIDDFRRQFETNIFGVLRTIYATLDDVKRTRGTIALIGSVSGHYGLPWVSAYTMSKFAVHGLAESLAADLAKDGVGVVLIAPGFVKTDIRKIDRHGVLREDAEDFAPEWLQMPAEQAADEIIDAIVRRERERVLTRLGKLSVAVARHAPGLFALATRLGTKRVRQH